MSRWDGSSLSTYWTHCWFPSAHSLFATRLQLVCLHYNRMGIIVGDPLFLAALNTAEGTQEVDVLNLLQVSFSQPLSKPNRTFHRPLYTEQGLSYYLLINLSLRLFQKRKKKKQSSQEIVIQRSFYSSVGLRAYSLGGLKMNMSGWQFSEHMSSSFERVLRFTIFNRSKAWSLYFRIADITFFFFTFFFFMAFCYYYGLKTCKRKPAKYHYTLTYHGHLPFFLLLD